MQLIFRTCNQHFAQNQPPECENQNSVTIFTEVHVDDARVFLLLRQVENDVEIVPYSARMNGEDAHDFLNEDMWNFFVYKHLFDHIANNIRSANKSVETEIKFPFQMDLLDFLMVIEPNWLSILLMIMPIGNFVLYYALSKFYNYEFSLDDD